MKTNLQTHFCVVQSGSGDSLSFILSIYRRYCRSHGRCRSLKDDIEKIQKLNDNFRYFFFFGQLTGAWRKSGVYCHRDRKKYHPSFVSIQKFPIFSVPYGAKRPWMYLWGLSCHDPFSLSMVLLSLSLLYYSLDLWPGSFRIKFFSISGLYSLYLYSRYVLAISLFLRSFIYVYPQQPPFLSRLPETDLSILY